MHIGTRDRLDSLIDPSLYRSDPQYHAQVVMFTAFLRHMELAMRDEGIAAEIIERVQNRIVTGVPQAGDGFARLSVRDQELLLAAMPIPDQIALPFSEENRTTHRDHVVDLTL